MKICRDCKWSSLPFPWIGMAENLNCNEPENIVTDKVSGKKSRRWEMCSVRRTYRDDCGPEGKLWEPR